MVHNEQLRLWLNGMSVHNDEHNECCPDFSCCNHLVETSFEVREAFVLAWEAGDEEQVNRMLMMFLGSALSDEKIYVTGG